MNLVQPHFVPEASCFVCFALSCTHLRSFVDAFTQDTAPLVHHRVYDVTPYSDNETITESIIEPVPVPS